MRQEPVSPSNPEDTPGILRESIDAPDAARPEPPWQQQVRCALAEKHILQTKRVLSDELGTPVTDVQLLKGGRTNIMLKLSTEAYGDVVIRLSPLEDGETRLLAELQLYRLIRSLEVPCAEPLAWRPLATEKPTRLSIGALSGSACILKYIDGIHPSSFEDLEMAGRALASLHNRSISREAIPECRLKFPDVSILQDFMEPSRAAYILYQMDQIQRALSSQPLALCHGEATASNLLIAKGGNSREVIFLDVESMGLGNPLLDLGMLLYGNVTVAENNVDRQGLNRVLYGYSKERNLSNSDLQALPLVAASCGVKIAAWRMTTGRHWGLNWVHPIRHSLAWLNVNVST